VPGAKEHLIDLCRLLGVVTPNEADPTGDWYAFEKRAEKTGGGVVLCPEGVVLLQRARGRWRTV